MLKLLLFISLTFCINCRYQKYYQEAYQIASSMTIDQKIGQTIQTDMYSVTQNSQTSGQQAAKYFMGSLLVGGNGVPDKDGNLVNLPNNEDQNRQVYGNGSMETWQKLADKFNYAVTVTTKSGKTYQIKPLLATDAVHNNQHVAGTILFPHNIGISCSHNPSNFYNLGYWTGINVKKSGFNYAFAPTVAVSHNPQWGRYYETMGQSSTMISDFAKSFTEGLQGTQQNPSGVIGSVKHFLGDGATMYGADEGNAHVGSFKSFLDHNLGGYKGSIMSGIGTVMCSYSAINWIPLSIGPAINTVLRNQLKFDGFVISDYDQINKNAGQGLPTNLQKMQFNQSIAQMLMAGIDMFMLPGYRQGFIDYIAAFKTIVDSQVIPIDRLNDAVAKILSVKMFMGLVTSNTQNLHHQQTSNIIQNHLTTEYEDSLQSVHESLVLLKNDKNLLPLSPSQLQYVVLIGEQIINIDNSGVYELLRSFDNIGMQCGGWSLRWQGFESNMLWRDINAKLANSSSILQALQSLQKSTLLYPNYTNMKDQSQIEQQRTQYLNKLIQLRPKMNQNNTIMIGVIGQPPFTQMVGDVNIPYCQEGSATGNQGCMFWANSYLLPKQRNTLEKTYDSFSNSVIDSIHDYNTNIPLLTVLLAGRPLIISDVLSQSTAVIDAFLPGTSAGFGILDAITGQYLLHPNGTEKNTLSFDWPKSMQQLSHFPVYSANGEIPTIQDPLFKTGYGLSTYSK